jgi:hypothetical protein
MVCGSIRRNGARAEGKKQKAKSRRQKAEGKKQKAKSRSLTHPQKARTGFGMTARGWWTLGGGVRVD